MAPLSERTSARRATWSVQEDLLKDWTSTRSCFDADKCRRHHVKHKTCILTLQVLNTAFFEALAEAPYSTEMQDEVEEAELGGADETDLREQARIEEIHRHLDDMNLASDELNLAQEDLVASEEELQKHVQTWASASAGLAETVGAKRIKKAEHQYREQRHLEAARRKVAQASAAFLKAKDARLSKRKCERLAANHARLLNEYQDAQVKFDCLRVASPVQSWVLDAVGQYFRAEDDFRMQIAFSEAAVLACQQRISEAKAQYQGALRSLELLSEQEHQARSSKHVN
mmetsp:Transcript_112162/g.198670  ORF Transcript_112162/g.198670 Transcript_112162/m.198670 type:complete len:286 (-) Transcript_112162:87-944(-)